MAAALRRVSAELIAHPPAAVRVPSYDRTALRAGIVHIGVGGFHRSHQALYLDDLLARGEATDWSIVGVGILPRDEALGRALTAQQCLYTLVERDSTSATARIVGSITSHLWGPNEPAAVFDRLADPAIRIVSVTATEGGYHADPVSGALDLEHPDVRHDLRELGPGEPPATIFRYLSEGLARRKEAGLAPFTLLSCDNLQHNGDVARATLVAFCSARSADLGSWVEANLSAPNSMVDRITPQTTDVERQLLRDRWRLDDACPVLSEPFRQWVIEDRFVMGRPPLEHAGVQFTDDVAPYEKMKLRLLNASHSALGYLGYLCGHRTVDQAAHVPDFRTYIEALMEYESVPTLDPVPGIHLPDYCHTVLDRFRNEAISDRLLRICMDGSSKLPKFVLPSIRDQLARGGPIRRLTLVIASWIRFLAGVDEQGSPILIEDPLAERLTRVVAPSPRDPRALLAMTDLFGDLGHSRRFAGELQMLLDALYTAGARHILRDASRWPPGG